MNRCCCRSVLLATRPRCCPRFALLCEPAGGVCKLQLHKSSSSSIGFQRKKGTARLGGDGKDDRLADVAFKASKSIDWEGMAKMIVTDEARKEFSSLRRCCPHRCHNSIWGCSPCRYHSSPVVGSIWVVIRRWWGSICRCHSSPVVGLDSPVPQLDL